MKKIFAEFRDFINRGNVIDMAVGVIIGGAFQKIVTSLVNDLIMPFVGLITGGVSFSEQFVVLKAPETLPEGVTAVTAANAAEVGATIFNYGAFITAVIDFIIMAFVIFLLVKLINRLSNIKKKPVEEPAAPTTKICPFCKSEIDITATRCPHCTSALELEEAIAE